MLTITMTVTAMQKMQFSCKIYDLASFQDILFIIKKEKKNL